MRRPDKEITARDDIDSIIERSLVCRLGMCDGGTPYVAPMSFGLDGDRLYFHSALEGMKIDILRRNPDVCVEFDIDVEVAPSESACSTTTRYRSVIAFGVAVIVDREDERRHGLDVISRHYLGRAEEYPASAMEKTLVIRVDIQRITGKKSGY